MGKVTGRSVQRNDYIYPSSLCDSQINHPKERRFIDSLRELNYFILNLIKMLFEPEKSILLLVKKGVKVKPLCCLI